MNTKTIEILHGVRLTPDVLCGAPVPFPNRGFISSVYVRKAQWVLVGYDVLRFDDGLYHGEIHPFALYDLLNQLGPAEVPHTKPDAIKLGSANVLGIRWDIAPSYGKVRIFGPRSDPADVIVFDLLQEDL